MGEDRGSFWRLPTRADPRNVTCAEVSGVLAAVQWALLVFWTCGMPVYSSGYSGRVHEHKEFYWLAIPLCLLDIGLRGFLSGHYRRVGAIVLVVTNLMILGFWLVALIHNARWVYGWE